MSLIGQDLLDELRSTSADLGDVVDEALKTVDDNLNTIEAAAIGAALVATAIVGYNMRHPEIAMYLAAEAGDVIQEIASEIGGLTSAVEVGGD